MSESQSIALKNLLEDTPDWVFDALKKSLYDFSLNGYHLRNVLETVEKIEDLSEPLYWAGLYTALGRRSLGDCLDGRDYADGADNYTRCDDLAEAREWLEELKVSAAESGAWFSDETMGACKFHEAIAEYFGDEVAEQLILKMDQREYELVIVSPPVIVKHVGVLGAAAPVIPGLNTEALAANAGGAIEFGNYDDDTHAEMSLRVRKWILGKFGDDAESVDTQGGAE